jgi:O-methyltransferase domain/Dimerisation domain
MQTQAPLTASSPPSPAGPAMLNMMTSYWISQAIYVAAKLGIADLVQNGPVHHETLAAASESDPPSLYRLMRALASVGIFAETSPGSFGLTPMAEVLSAVAPNSMRALALTYNEELYHAWGDMLYSVQTGQPAFDHVYGMPVFEYFASHPSANAVFNAAMVDWTKRVASAVVAAYDFSSFDTVIDVGGGYGALLTEILRSNPGTRGILFDQPHVVADAASFLHSTGVSERCTSVGGDFFADVPPGGDAYLLAQILHDWGDAQNLTILSRCRSAMPAHARLLVVELVLPETDEPNFGKWLDLHMLAVARGRERTAAEYADLLRTAGFKLTRIVPTESGTSVVEAELAH